MQEISENYFGLRKNKKIDSFSGGFFFGVRRILKECASRGISGGEVQAKSTAINGAKAGQLLRHSSCITAKGNLCWKLAFRMLQNY